MKVSSFSTMESAQASVFACQESSRREKLVEENEFEYGKIEATYFCHALTQKPR
jgi:hypothetical protein